MPKHRPRMFAANAGKDTEHRVDFGWWFDFQPGCGPLAALARGDGRALERTADAEQAVARRAVIFRITDRAQIGFR
eukprot:1959753-Alexandrium_andersonii.AAC.1